MYLTIISKELKKEMEAKKMYWSGFSKLVSRHGKYKRKQYVSKQYKYIADTLSWNITKRKMATKS